MPRIAFSKVMFFNVAIQTLINISYFEFFGNNEELMFSAVPNLFKEVFCFVALFFRFRNVF